MHSFSLSICSLIVEFVSLLYGIEFAQVFCGS